MMRFANPYRSLERALGYRFRRKKRLLQALTHPSYRHETEGIEEDNQRLEFLGDAALGLAVAAELYERFQREAEGDLTKRRSLMTSTRGLAELARRIDLGAHLRLGKGEWTSGGRDRPTILADALEAVLGAAYIDGGIKAVSRIIRHLMDDPLQQRTTDPHIENPKGLLQERAQRAGGGNPRYTVIREEGPAHEKWYRVEVRVGDRLLAEGEGMNKRDAESDAARKALMSYPG